MSADVGVTPELLLDKIAEIRRARMKLLEFPTVLSAARGQGTAARTAVKEWTERLAGVSGEFLLEIQNEPVDVPADTEGATPPVKAALAPPPGPRAPAPKLKFTNDATRQAELKRRLATDNEAGLYKKQIAIAEADVHTADQAVSRFEDEQGSWESYLNGLMKEADLLIAMVAIKSADVKILELNPLVRTP